VAKSRPPSDDDIIASLKGASQKVSDAELDSIFGDTLPDVKELAAKAANSNRKRGKRSVVYLLPGIMGSELGYVRRLLWDDVLWLGLIDVLMGRLKRLRIGADAKIASLGFLPGVYVPMRLELERAGYEVKKFHYDWRQDIVSLGAALKQQVDKEKEDVMIVAHSMGGLVARAAFKQGMKGVTRFVMLATPNKGSLSPVEAFRGYHSLAGIIANVDLMNDAVELAKNVFGTFPGLHQMILDKSVNETGLDLSDLASWPTGLRPRADLLKLAVQIQDKLALPEDAPNSEWFVIAGSQLPTKVAVRKQSDAFEYKITDQGDGTVPVGSALLPGVKKTWYGSAEHPFFTGNKAVRSATVEILATGQCSLNTSPPDPVDRETWVTEEELKRAARVVRSTRAGGAEVPYREQLRLLFGAPMVLTLSKDGFDLTDGAQKTRLFENVIISRQKTRRLEICLYNGSITEVNARAYVLGAFPGVTPTGASSALDELMGGAIRDLTSHNMFGAGTGEIFILPLARYRVQAETAVFAGLGPFDEFRTRDVPQGDGSGTMSYLHNRYVPALEIAAENVAHTLSRTYLEDFATVPLGGTVCGDDPKATSESLLRGLLRGLELSDGKQRMRRVTICETDKARYNAIRAHLLDLATSPLCESLEVILTDQKPTREVSALRAFGFRGIRTLPKFEEPAYLMVRSDSGPKPASKSSTVTLRYTILGPTGRAAVREPQPVEMPRVEFERILSPVRKDQVPSVAALENMGSKIGSDLMPKQIIEDLNEFANLPLVLLHDAGVAASVPWETLKLGAGQSPALTHGLTRRFIVRTAECRRWSAPNVLGRKVKILLVSNPTKDLTGAAKEAVQIKNLLGAHASFDLDDSLSGDAATKKAIIKKLQTGSFDIVHYSGHAYFDKVNPGKCGLICAHDETLTGPDLAGIPQLPFLMLVNACQSALTRGEKGKPQSQPKDPGLRKKPKRAAPSRSIAETMLCAGIANYIGTYWPVGDTEASTFAATLYTSLLVNKKENEKPTLGSAVRAARNAIAPDGGGEDFTSSVDWANYILYGNPNSSLEPEKE
jgi:pimeloyl-ACP methyl ester carboxylesterase